MSTPTQFEGKLALPLIAAPMFLVSGVELVTECCKAGVIGTFPALNQRTSDGFEQWLIDINNSLESHTKNIGKKPAPFGVNLVVHKSNTRLQDDLDICIKHKVPLVITSLGINSAVVDAIHSYGGLVFHDVINTKHAKKAASAGVDGLIAVAAGAGGHGGTLNPFALVNEIRAFYDKTIILAGSLTTGSDIAAAQVMGADLAYMGTRFINTEESLAQAEYKAQIVDVSSEDIIYTPVISGVHANFISQSVAAAGVNLDELKDLRKVNITEELNDARDNVDGAKPWKDIWAAGQGVGSIHNVLATSALINQIKTEYVESINNLQNTSLQFKN